MILYTQSALWTWQCDQDGRVMLNITCNVLCFQYEPIKLFEQVLTSRLGHTGRSQGDVGNMSSRCWNDYSNNHICFCAVWINPSLAVGFEEKSHPARTTKSQKNFAFAECEWTLKPNPDRASASAANAGLWWRLKIGPRPIPKHHYRPALAQTLGVGIPLQV